MRHTKREETGVFFGMKNIENRIEYIGKPKDKDGHILVVGGAGSGKSTCVAIPTLETWEGTIFAIDIKGELTKYWNEKLADKRPTKIINLTKDKGDYPGYDPFYFLKQAGDDDLVQNAREIAQAIIQIPPNVLEPFWLQAAQHVLTASLLYHYKCCKAPFIEAIKTTQKTPLNKLVKMISQGDCEEAQLHIKQFVDGADIPDNKMMAGISAELSNKIMVFATDPRIKAAFDIKKDTAEESVKWEDLEGQNIFMRIAEDKLGQWDGAITLMLTQLIRSLERRHDKQYDPDGKPLVLSEHGEVIPPTLLLLDEFPRLGKVDVIQNAVSTLRSKGVTICIMMQSLAQLDRTYGKETRQIVVDNCPYKAILQVTDPENQKTFSDTIGTIKVGMRGYSEGSGTSNGSNNGETSGEGFNEITGENFGEMLVRINAGRSKILGNTKTKQTGKSKSTQTGSSTNTARNTNESREPLIHPHELATLDDILLLTPKGFCRIDKAPYYKLNKSASINKTPEQPSPATVQSPPRTIDKLRDRIGKKDARDRGDGRGLRKLVQALNRER